MSADAADKSRLIPYEEDSDGAHTFTIPVEALDAPVLCAAYSKNKELWYDRTLLFRADSLPVEAFREGFFTTPASLSLADGNLAAGRDLYAQSGGNDTSILAGAALAGGITGGAFSGNVEVLAERKAVTVKGGLKAQAEGGLYFETGEDTVGSRQGTV